MIIAIMAAIGIPSYQNIIRDNRLASATNTLLGALQYARSEAVTQRTVISVVPKANNNWATGVEIRKGATKLRELPAGDADIAVTASGSATKIDYKADGTTSAVSLTLTDGRNKTREIRVNGIGQACAGSSCS